ncbi:TerC family protein [Paenibacillus marinisediminis]
MESLWLLLEILVINIVLSGDNAVVIAMSTQHLSDKARKQAVWIGAGGAIVLRIVLTVAAMWLMAIPLLQAAGGIMLSVIAVQLLGDSGTHRGGQETSLSLLSAIKTILIADVVMSLDNVLAIAAISKGHFPYLVIGIALSIPIILWGSTMISGWLQKYPLLIYGGAAILGYTSGEMIAGDSRLILWLPRLWSSIDHLLPWVLAVVVLVLGFWLRRNPNELEPNS